jgi:hypothetical protein
MFRFVLQQKYIKLDMEERPDRATYNKLLNCPDIRIKKEKDTYIPPTSAVYDKMGNLLVDAEPAGFIKEVTYEIIGEKVPNEFK